MSNKIKGSLSSTIAVMLVCAICACSTLVAAALPNKSKANMGCSTIIKTSGKIASVTASAKGNSTVTKIVIKAELQKQDGSSWKTIKTWSSSSNSSSASLQKTATILSNASYRVKTTFTLYAGTTSENIIKIAY